MATTTTDYDGYFYGDGDYADYDCYDYYAYD